MAVVPSDKVDYFDWYFSSIEITSSSNRPKKPEDPQKSRLEKKPNDLPDATFEVIVEVLLNAKSAVQREECFLYDISIANTLIKPQH